MAIDIKVTKPPLHLHHLVESLWMLHNSSDEEKEVVVVPDGRIDLSLSVSKNESFHILLMGLSSTYDQVSIPPQTTIFAISFNPIVAGFILQTPMASLLNSALQLPDDFWGFDKTDLTDFDRFCKKAFTKLEELSAGKTADARKLKLFELIYATRGAATVAELSEQTQWNSRQINRYFNQYYGLSLKAYCNIIRFRASFQQLRQGKLFPEEDFADQSHFIKEIKKLSGVSPKKLAKNKNDRFIQFSALPPP